MTFRKSRIAAAFLSVVLLLGLTSSTGRAQNEELTRLLDRVSDRIASYPDITDWTASVKSTIFTMDRDWQPKKTTYVEKTVVISNSLPEEKIISAVEESRGQKKDVTQELRRKAQRDAEKAKKNAQKNRESGRQNVDAALTDYFPFSRDKRDGFLISVIQDAEYEGRPAYLFQVESKEEDKDAWEGIYYVDRNSLDVFRVEIKPAQNPGALKSFRMELDLQVLPQGYLVLQKSRVRLHVDLAVKQIRIEAEELYSNYDVTR